MQNPSSYYAVPKCDGRVWSDWQQSQRDGSSSWASTSVMTLKDASLYPTAFADPAHCSAIPISYTLTPPTPDSITDSDVSVSSSSSQLSMESIPEFDDMPEIPFVSAAVAYADEWMIAPDRPAEQARCGTPCPSPSSASSSPSFWSGIVGLRPSASKSSSTSASSTSDTSSPVLGYTSVRSISPSRASNGSRKRAGSLSSIASSRTKPAPAKSILSSGSSVKTRKHKAPSVKFLDMPTIHYDDEYPCGGEDEEYDECGRRATGSPSASKSSMSPPPKKKVKGLSGFLSFRWLFGPSSKVENRETRRRAPDAGPGRPAISGPYPLWDSPPRRARGDAGSSHAKSSAASLHSVRSNGSLRSMRSCASRLPTYFPR
ncbi:hypothetical protein BV20DRAFT_517299 [Pilatotrama ljubarskyi]|nr:hypothetical protein BV20DRAFT_517299 [Pilatotrama ljubarskyi]